MATLPRIQRPRLLEQIDGAAQLTLLHAPLGYGKTVLVKQWAQERDGNTVWLRACDCPEDPSTLSEKFSDEDTALIVDNYQQVTSIERDKGFLRLLEENPRLRVILSSRAFSFLTSPLVPTRVATSIISWEDLQFTAEEVAELRSRYDIAADYDLGLDSQEQAAWPQGLQAQLLTASGAAPGDLSTDRLTYELLDGLASSLQRETLRAAAVASWMGPETLSRFLGVSREQALDAINELEKAGLVVLATAPLESRIGVHPALQQAVEAESRYHFGEGRARQLLRLHANHLRIASPAHALEMLLDAEDYEAADRIAPSAFGAPPGSPFHPGLMAQKLPLEKLRNLPVLLHLRLRADRADLNVPIGLVTETAEMLREAASRELEIAASDRPIIIQGDLLAALRNLGEWELAGTYASDYQRRLDQFEASGGPGLAATMSFGYSIATLTGTLTGDYALARAAAESGRELALDSGYGMEQIRADGQLALIKALTGRTTEAASHLEEGQGRVSRDPAHPASPARIDGSLARLLVAHYSRAPESVEDLLAELLDSARRAEQWPIFVVAEGGLIRQLHGDYEAFLLMRQRMAEYPRELPDISPFWTDNVHSQMANLATYAGRYGDAEEALADAPATYPVSLAARARLALFKGDTEQVPDLVNEGLRASPDPATRHDLMLLGAGASFSLGESTDAWALLSEVQPGFATQLGQMAMTTLPYTLQQSMYQQWEQESGDASLSEFLEEIPGRLRPEVYEPLSAAETRTLRVMRDGGTVNEAAEVLLLSPNTVKSQLRASYRKLGVSGRAEALTKAEQLGLFDREPEEEVV